MAIVSERSEFIKDLMEVLGLDGSNVIGFTLRAHVQEPVMLEVEMYADPPESDVCTRQLIKRWKITKEEITE